MNKQSNTTQLAAAAAAKAAEAQKAAKEAEEAKLQKAKEELARKEAEAAERGKNKRLRVYVKGFDLVDPETKQRFEGGRITEVTTLSGWMRSQVRAGLAQVLED